MPHLFLKNRLKPSLRTARTTISIFFLSFITVLLYSKTMSAPFMFDSLDYILNDSALYMTELSGASVKTAMLESKPRHRPLSNLSFAFNYFFAKHDVSTYHITNIAIHLLAGLCLFGFIQALLTDIPADPGNDQFSTRQMPFFIAFFAAFIWMVHPVNTQSVTYIVQRMTSLAALFYILSLWLYALGRNAWNRIGQDKRRSFLYFSGSVITGFCAFTSKENTATLPVMVILYEFIFHQRLTIRWSKSKIMWGIFTTIVLGGLVFYFTGGHPIHRILDAYTRREFTLSERVLTECRVVIYYISLFMFPDPSRLNLDYDFPLSHSLLDCPTTILSIIALTALIVLAVYRARRHRLLTFCILWFFVTLLIESSIVGIEIIFEHRTYLPFMMLSLLLSDRIFRRMPPRLAVLVLCGLGVLFSAWTYQRNMAWQTPTSLWTDCVKKSPQDTRALTQLGNAYRDSNQIKQAKLAYYAALKINPFYASAHNNLGNIFAEEANFNSAIYHFKQAIDHDPKPVLAYHNLGNVFVRQGKLNQAIDQYKKALEINPQYLPAKKTLQMLGKFKSPEIH